MKKFLVRLGVWLLILIVVAVAVDAMVTTGLRKVGTRKYAVWNDIYKGGIDADLVVIGSSQAWCSYNTFMLDSLLNVNSYNLGIDGHPLPLQLLRYETYRRFNSNPKIILLNVSYFGSFSISSDEQYEREQFFPYITDRVLVDKVAEIKHLTWLDRCVPLYRYFGYRDDVEMGVAAFLGKSEFPDGNMHKGYRGNVLAWQAPSWLGSSLSYPIDKDMVALLEEFVKDISEFGIELVFVKYPAYYSWTQRVENIKVTDSIFETIAAEYDVPILDYYYSGICKDSANYYNFSHLNNKGSELFTKKLCHDLDSLGILSGL